MSGIEPPAGMSQETLQAIEPEAPDPPPENLNEDEYTQAMDFFNMPEVQARMKSEEQIPKEVLAENYKHPDTPQTYTDKIQKLFEPADETIEEMDQAGRGETDSVWGQLIKPILRLKNFLVKQQVKS